MIKRYTSDPLEIEAIKFNGENYKECEDFIGKKNYDNTLNYPNIKTKEGIMEVSIGDYIIKGTHGEFYPCKPDIFEYKYRETLKIKPKMTKIQILYGKSLVEKIKNNNIYNYIKVKVLKIVSRIERRIK